MKLTDNVPFYVTRKDADEMTYSFSVSAWLPLYTSIIAWIAAFLWAIIAVVYAGEVIVNAVVSVVS